MSSYAGPKEVVFQIPEGIDAASWVESFLTSQSSEALAQYQGITIKMVDPQGNLLWQGPLPR